MRSFGLIIRLAIYVALPLISISCVTDRELLKTYRKSSIYNGFGRQLAVNGSYKNLDTAPGRSLLRDLSQCYSRKGYSYGTHALDSAIIHLHYDGAGSLSVSVSSPDTVFEAFSLKVKNKGLYLSTRHKLFLIPIPFFYIQTETKGMLITDDSGRLVFVHGFDGGGWVVFMVAGNSDLHAAVYKRQGG